MEKKSHFINVRFPDSLYNEIHSQPVKPSRIIREAVELWMNQFRLESKCIEIRENENYMIIGKAHSGKTSLVKSLLKGLQKMKIILDSHKEYSEFGKVCEIHYDKKASDKDANLQAWISEQCNTLVASIQSSESIVIQPKFEEIGTEVSFVSELLKKVIESDSNNSRLVVIESAERYQDILSVFVSQCLNKKVQMILVSRTPLKKEISTNATPILGLIEIKDSSFPEEVVKISSRISKYNWIWLDTKEAKWKTHIMPPDVARNTKTSQSIEKATIDKEQAPVKQQPVSQENKTP